MTRGGSRVNSGPTPDPTALRPHRTDRAGWRTLPGPYTGKPPAWPLPPDFELRSEHAIAERNVERLEDELVTASGPKATGIQRKLSTARVLATKLELQLADQERLEAEVWAEIWKTPHAHVWIELGWTTEVALYVRHLNLAGMGSMDDAREARQWSDRLGLNPAAMLRNRWVIAPVGQQGGPPASESKPAVKRSSARDRLSVVK